MDTTHSMGTSSTPVVWPDLPFAAWEDTCATLHMWTQIVGKVRLTLSPLVNHWWSVTLYVSSRGLTTSPIPYGTRSFAVTFDFIDHNLYIQTSDGASKAMGLFARSVADFYREFMSALRALGIDVTINTLPSEVANPIACDVDEKHCSYDGAYVHRWWQVLVESDRVMKVFRARYIGKCSPVHFFWGSFDLAVTRFSGRRAPERPGADKITREAYSHEVSSCGFWPGSPGVDAAYYAYFSPAPKGLDTASVRPRAAFYSADLGEFLLPYEAVRTSADPDATLLDFFQSTYNAGAELAHWDRAALER